MEEGNISNSSSNLKKNIHGRPRTSFEEKCKYPLSESTPSNLPRSPPPDLSCNENAWSKYKAEFDELGENTKPSVETAADTLPVEFDKIPERENSWELCAEARKRQNVGKNRYPNILPFDDTRVRLTRRKFGNDYINACNISFGNYKAICSQAPILNETMEDFWEMIITYKCPAIFMLTRLIENGKEKASKYWPCDGSSNLYGNITVHSIDTFDIDEVFHVSELLVEEKKDSSNKKEDEEQKKSEGHTVFHIFYDGWPDHGVPDVPDDFILMLEFWDIFRRITNDPIVIHCSAGVGRSGTLASAKMYQVTGISPNIVIERLREQRWGSVQTVQQYEFLVECCKNIKSTTRHV